MTTLQISEMMGISVQEKEKIAFKCKEKAYSLGYTLKSYTEKEIGRCEIIVNGKQYLRVKGDTEVDAILKAFRMIVQEGIK